MISTSINTVGKNVIAFKFCIGQKVRIKEADVSGVIKQMCVIPSNREYLVAYFDDNKCRQTEWLSESELSAC